jgi:myb proto-oncogene protein
MRKKAQERKMSLSSPSSSSSSLTYQACLLDTVRVIGMGSGDTHNGSCVTSALENTQSAMDGYPMDQIWKEIEAPQAHALLGIAEGKEKTCSSIPCHLPSPAMWDYKYTEVFWKMEDQETMM